MAKAMPKMDARRLIHEVFTTESSHMSLDEAVADFPVGSINAKTPNVPFSFWHILEHIRIAQTDLLEYVQNAKHVSPSWPDGYWPKPDATTDAAGWKRTIATIKKDLKRIDQLLADPKVDIFAPVPFANGKSVLRCVFLAIDHNSYHLGEFGILRQTMNLWPRNRKDA
ncbi:MAG: ABC transporter [Candidatus Rokuibacteriota bacterium]|nr:MAG: ABC transporter [Candidatus Rokubacteria bacterium]